MHGRIVSRWERKENEVNYHFEIPCNTTAKVHLYQVEKVEWQTGSCLPRAGRKERPHRLQKRVPEVIRSGTGYADWIFNNRGKIIHVHRIAGMITWIQQKKFKQRRKIMKKKVVSVLLSVLMITGLTAGCGGGTGEGESTDGGTSEEPRELSLLVDTTNAANEGFLAIVDLAEEELNMTINVERDQREQKAIMS